MFGHTGLDGRSRSNIFMQKIRFNYRFILPASIIGFCLADSLKFGAYFAALIAIGICAMMTKVSISEVVAA